jgi:hypothetical protein
MASGSINPPYWVLHLFHHNSSDPLGVAWSVFGLLVTCLHTLHNHNPARDTLWVLVNGRPNKCVLYESIVEFDLAVLAPDKPCPFEPDLSIRQPRIGEPVDIHTPVDQRGAAVLSLVDPIILSWSGIGAIRAPVYAIDGTWKAGDSGAPAVSGAQHLVGMLVGRTIQPKGGIILGGDSINYLVNQVIRNHRKS